MKRGLTASFLLVASLLCTLSFGVTAASAAGITTGTGEGATYFRNQLNDNAQKIYDKLLKAFEDGTMRSGKGEIKLEGDEWQSTIQAYLKGNRELFNDFAAAKDAFDLDHSEAWYVDSSYLSLYVAQDSSSTSGSSGKYVAIIGPGRSTTYLLDGVEKLNSGDTGKMDGEIESVISSIVSGANSAAKPGMNAENAKAAKVKYVHDEVTKRISYRFENECTDKNVPYLRTLYALVTHEGVCESYARSMQVILTRLGIPCVLVHGLQTSGDAPEMHMWNEVKLNNQWYVVDATWDDPVKVNNDGTIIKGGSNGNDGSEHTRYLLVGADTTTMNWVPSGTVSTGDYEFSYPTVANTSYQGESIFSNESGLDIKYDATNKMEDEEAGTFTISYHDGNQELGLKKMAKKGLYLLYKQYDYHPDGTNHVLDEWYYVEGGLAVVSPTGAPENPYFNDKDTRLTMVNTGCEYVEYALTTRKPEGYDTWWKAPNEGNQITATNGECCYYKGDESDIVADSGLLFNMNSSYEAQPFVYRQYPKATGQVAIQDYEAKVVFDDRLLPISVPSLASLSSDAPAGAQTVSGEGGVQLMANSTSTGSEHEDPYAVYAQQKANLTNYGIKVTYQCSQPDSTKYIEENANSVVPHELYGEVDFDTNRDHQVDPDKITWLYDCKTKHTHNPQSCKLVGLKFDFDPSSNWADDLTLYSFSLEGVMGSRSSKAPNSWGYICSTPSCPMGYRSQGIDWNLWARPNLMDNPDDLDLNQITVKGVDGKEGTLKDLQTQMRSGSINGRLMLVAEDLSNSRAAVEELQDALSDPSVNKEGTVQSDAIKGRSLYEISFTRICKAVVPKTGDSMRVQVGYPQGFDANSDVVFKAYHFTRDEAGNIISVEEIPVIMTEYGLIVLCDSFSPFEMVALDKTKVTGNDENVVNKSVVVTTDGGAKVTVDSKDGTPVNTQDTAQAITLATNPSQKEDALTEKTNGSVVKYGDSNDTHTFTIKPDEGQKVSGVLLGGKDILDKSETGVAALTAADNTVTVTVKGDKLNNSNALLNISTTPESVLTDESGQSLTPVTVEMCQHKSTSVTKPSVDPQCTKAGKTAEKKCNDCQQIIAQQTEIPPLGHECNEDGTCSRSCCNGKYIYTFDKGFAKACAELRSAIPQDMVLVDEKNPTSGKKPNPLLNANYYTADSWKPFSEALTNAKDLLTKVDTKPQEIKKDITKNELTQAKDKLTSAQQALAKVTYTKDTLQKLVDAAKNEKGDIYTEASWKNYEKALAAAREALQNNGQDKQDEIAAACANLLAAEQQLLIRPLGESAFTTIRSTLSTIGLLNKDHYTQETWNALQAVIAKVQEAFKDTSTLTQEQLTALEHELVTAFNALKKAPLPGHVTLDDLKAYVDEVATLNQSLFTKESWEPFAKALAEAKAGMLKAELPDDEIQTLYKNLYDAEAQLKLIDVDNPALAPLNQLIENIKALHSSLYTPASWNALKAALDKAVEALANEDISLDEVNTLFAELEQAFNALEPVNAGENATPVYRLYNPYEQTHLFTADATEYAELKEAGWNDESVAWIAPAIELDGGSKLTRLYNPYSKDHYYSNDPAEIAQLKDEGWVPDSEASAIYSAPTNGSEVWCLYNPYRKVDTHIWTQDPVEKAQCQKDGWVPNESFFYAINTTSAA